MNSGPCARASGAPIDADFVHLWSADAGRGPKRWRTASTASLALSAQAWTPPLAYSRTPSPTFQRLSSGVSRGRSRPPRRRHRLRRRQHLPRRGRSRPPQPSRRRRRRRLRRPRRRMGRGDQSRRRDRPRRRGRRCTGRRTARLVPAPPRGLQATPNGRLPPGTPPPGHRQTRPSCPARPALVGPTAPNLNIKITVSVIAAAEKTTRA